MIDMIDKLLKDKIAAMKENNVIAKKILSLLHSDALSMAKKEMRLVISNDVVTCAKTLIKRNKQAIIDVQKGKGNTSELEKEIEILYSFLPAQKSEEEIKNIIDTMLSAIPPEERTRKIQGKIMKQLVTEYAESIDMGIASKYISEKL